MLRLELGLPRKRESFSRSVASFLDCCGACFLGGFAVWGDRENQVKLLVSTIRTQGRRQSDFCFVPEGEVLTFGFECATDRGHADGLCGCVRSMAGIVCKGSTTTFKVSEVPITTFQMKALLRDYYFGMKLSDKTLGQEVLALVGVAQPYEVGVVLEKRAPIQGAVDAASSKGFLRRPL